MDAVVDVRHNWRRVLQGKPAVITVNDKNFCDFVVHCADFYNVHTQDYIAKIVCIYGGVYSKRKLFLSFVIRKNLRMC